MRTNGELFTAIAEAPSSRRMSLPPESREIPHGASRGSVFPPATMLATETIFAGLSYFLAVLLVYKVGTGRQFLSLPTILIVLGIRLLSLYWLGPYKGSLRYAGVHELLGLVK